MKQSKSILLFLCFFISTAGYAQGSPIPLLKKTASQITAKLQANKSALKKDSHLIYKTVRSHLLPVVDVRGMARSVLGRQAWRKASSSQKKRFTKEFTKLVIRTYASPLAEYTDEKVKFFPIRGSTNKRFLKVKSLIVRSHGPNIPLNYSLVSKKGQWKIYDISVEGVSLLQSFHSQFAQSLRNSNLDNLIQVLHKHNKNHGSS